MLAGVSGCQVVKARRRRDHLLHHHLLHLRLLFARSSHRHPCRIVGAARHKPVGIANARGAVEPPFATDGGATTYVVITQSYEMASV